jgi:hypothetical protein
MKINCLVREKIELIGFIDKLNLHKTEEFGKNDTKKSMFLMILIDPNKEIIQVFLMTPSGF